MDARERVLATAARTILLRIGLLLCLIAAAYRPAHAGSLCESCEVQLGLGGTYHFWGTTGGVVIPVTVNWSDSRYELGFFRVTTQQVLYDSASRYGRLMADPYWGVSLSRRWRIFERGRARLLFEFRLAGKTESDQLSTTRWDFASQLGVRYRLPGDRITAELTVRHWSNGGLRLPNHGQDFATLTFKVNSGLVGVPRADQIRLDSLFVYVHSQNFRNDTNSQELDYEPSLKGPRLALQ